MVFLFSLERKKYQEHLTGYENIPHCPKAQIKNCRIPLQPLRLPSEHSKTLKVLLFLQGLQKHWWKSQSWTPVHGLHELWHGLCSYFIAPPHAFMPSLSCLLDLYLIGTQELNLYHNFLWLLYFFFPLLEKQGFLRILLCNSREKGSL